MSSIHVVKLGSSTILESATICDELLELVRQGGRVLVVAGGALGIERHYQAVGRRMRFLELKNGERFRHCPPDEMEAIRDAYLTVVLPRLARELGARGLAVFAATADQHGLVTGRQHKPLRAVVEGRDVILRDHRAGGVTGVRRAALLALMEQHDIVAISPPIGEEGTGLPLNIDADMLAAGLSNALGAHHLRFVTSTAGVLREGRTVRSLCPRGDADFVTGRMKQKLRAAQAAIDGGVADVSISGRHSFLAAEGETRCFGAEPPVEEASLLTHAVEIPSVSGDERALARFLVEQCREGGLDARVDEVGNLVARKGSGPRRLLLLGHLDTVPLLWPVRWSEAGLTGRGAVDAKSSLVNFIEVLRGLDVPEGVEVRVVGATEEEVSSSRGAFHVRDHYPADAVIVGEPSGSRALALGYFGLFKLRLRVTVPLGHSAAQEARSAPDGVYELCQRLRGRVGAADPRGLSSLLEVRSWQDAAGGHAEGILNFRISPQARVSPELVQDLGGVEVLRATPGVSFGRTTSLARAFARAFAAEGVTPRYVVKKGTSDMNTLATTWTGVPMVAYGPGDSTLDHTMAEEISWEEYREANRVLTKAVNEWMRST